ncbi:hypothetical protein ACPCAJ_21155 [Streptomyces griseoincarnatus]
MADREYHFVVTLQFKRDGEPGVFSNTIEGTITAGRGATRQDLYRDVYARACEALEVSNGVTLFCMIEPNRL